MYQNKAWHFINMHSFTFYVTVKISCKAIDYININWTNKERKDTISGAEEVQLGKSKLIHIEIQNKLQVNDWFHF
jgi:hypothetical protein